jgi:hypothetical protein
MLKDIIPHVISYKGYKISNRKKASEYSVGLTLGTRVAVIFIPFFISNIPTVRRWITNTILT